MEITNCAICKSTILDSIEEFRCSHVLLVSLTVCEYEKNTDN